MRVNQRPGVGGRLHNALPTLANQVSRQFVIQNVLVRAETSQPKGRRLLTQRRRALAQQRPMETSVLKVPLEMVSLLQQDVARAAAAEIIVRRHQPAGMDLGHGVARGHGLAGLGTFRQRLQRPALRRRPRAARRQRRPRRQALGNDEISHSAVEHLPGIQPGRRLARRAAAIRPCPPRRRPDR